MQNSKFPEGWDEARVRGVLDHDENQSEEEAVAVDEAVYGKIAGNLASWFRLSWYLKCGH